MSRGRLPPAAHGKTPHLRSLGEKLKDRVEKGGATFYQLLW